MPGFVPGLGLAAKLTSVFPDPQIEGRSTHAGLIAKFDENDGQLLAIVDGDAVTATRTAASATVAYQALAPPDVERIVVVGAGTQARAQLEFLDHLAVDAEVVVVSRSHRSAAALAEEFGATSANSIEAAITSADVVFCCTDAAEPVIDHDWLLPHAHVGSVGGSRGPELDRATIAEGTVFVEWPGASTCPPPAGAHELQDLPDDHARLIGSVLEADRPVRDPVALTVFKSTGYAGLDVAAAAVAYGAASASGRGAWVDL